MRTILWRGRCSGLYRVRVERDNGYDRVLDLSHTNPTQRRGETVTHPRQPWTATTHAYLRYLQEHDVDAAQRVAGSGFDTLGDETLVWIEGEVLADRLWPRPEESLFAIGRMLRELHAVSESFVPASDAVWMPWTLRDFGPGSVVSHGNIAPWHIVFQNGRPHALIGWEYAGPVQPVEELAATAWFCAQLHDEDVAARVGLPDVHARGRWLRAFLDGYEWPKAARAGLITAMIEFAIKDTGMFARLHNFSPESTDEQHLWLLSWQTRSALWMLENRAVLSQMACA